MDAPFRSFVPARTLAPLVMFVTGIVIIAEGAAIELDLGGACLVGLGIPTLGTTAVAWALARRRFGTALSAGVGWAAAHALLALAIAGGGSHGEELLYCFAVASGITFALAIPGWCLGTFFALRKELDAGDTLLMWSAGWFGLLQIPACLLFGEKNPLPVLVVFLACAVLFALTARRAVLRRTWCARIAAERDGDWGVREPRPEERTTLAPLYALRNRPCLVLERRSAGPTMSTPYRSGITASPFALVPASR